MSDNQFTPTPPTNALGLLFKEAHEAIFDIIRRSEDIGALRGRRQAFAEMAPELARLRPLSPDGAAGQETPR